jgi:hypothetical protein
MESRNSGGGVASRGSITIVISSQWDGKKDEKWCWRCRRFKDRRTDFYGDKSRRDGVEDLCKKCSDMYGKEKRLKRKLKRNSLLLLFILFSGLQGFANW